jgi:sugar transferase (PEP-CTERM system associated)
MSLLKPVLRHPFASLACAEVTVFAAAFHGALRICGHLAALPALAGSLCCAALLGLAMFAMGLYSRRQRAAFHGTMLRAIAAISAGVLVVAVLGVVCLPSVITPKTLFLAWAMCIGAATLSRFLFEQLIDEAYFKRRVLVLGAGKQASHIVRLRRRADRRGFHIHGFVPFPGEITPSDLTPLVDPGAELLAYCRAHHIEEIVVALDEKRGDFPLQALLDVRMSGIPVVELIDFLERETGTVRLDVVNPSWFIYSSGFNQSSWRVLTQRSFDILMSSALLIIAAIPMLIVVLAMKLTEGRKAPLLYKQLRVGLEGRHFNVLKFRSMRTDAEAAGAVWATKNDPRITAVGRFMRKTRIDELPQIFNVFVGDMSFVGPRPERPQFVEKFEERIPYYRERHAVKPGITGWAQLCYAYGASEEDAFYKLQYDLFYIKRQSLVFDFVILLQTVEVVLWGKGR